MTSICENHFSCPESSGCDPKDAIQSLNNMLLNTIEEIDENNVNCATDVTTKWKYLARTINEAYNIVLNENLKYKDISSDTSKILNGNDDEDIVLTYKESREETSEVNQSKLGQLMRYVSETLFDKSRKSSLEVIAEAVEFDKEESMGRIDSATNELISSKLDMHTLSTDHLELLENFQHLEVTTNQLINEYLYMHEKTILLINNQNRKPTLIRSDSIADLIQQLSESVCDSPGPIPVPLQHTENNQMTPIEIAEQTQNVSATNENSCNTEAQMYVLHRKESATGMRLAHRESSKSLTIKTASTECSIKHRENNDNVVAVIQEAVEDFNGYMNRIKLRIDRTKRDFDMLRTILDGTILDCENSIDKAKHCKVRSLKSTYNIRSAVQIN